MKNFLVLMICIMCVRAQNAPTFQAARSSDGKLTLTWPVQTIFQGITPLRASYFVESSGNLVAWQNATAILPGDAFTNLVTVSFASLTNVPATFFRVRAVLDFAGRSFPNVNFPSLKADGATFMGSDLFNVTLNSASLTNADFSAADLRNAKLRSINGHDADFLFARLSDADLSDADLTRADLRFADLNAADLTFCVLDHADLRGTILTGVRIIYTRFHGSRIDAQTLLDPAGRANWEIVNDQGAGKTYTNLDLSFSDFSGGNLSNANLANSDLRGSDLRDTDLRGARLSTTALLAQTDWRGSIIDDKTIIPPKWNLVWSIINQPQSGRILTNIDLSNAFWVGTTFDGANISNANFANGIMSDSNFGNVTGLSANFVSAQFQNCALTNANFQGANFTNAQFEDVDFSNTNLRNALTNGAVFTRPIFRNTTMPNGTIRNK